MTKGETSCPRLIETALPVREISAESVRDKYIPSLHPKHIHVWWARRPLAAARAVVFASIIPDPDDPRCPNEFRQLVEKLLKNEVPAELRYYRRKARELSDPDPYRPYEGVDDTLRNRLMMFVAKWSPEAHAFELGKSSTEPKPSELLDDRSLVKWEISDPENAQAREVLRVAVALVQAAHQGKAPVVLDHFAGGGSIPVEASRLGCHSIANECNPVAYLVLRATCEYPQTYGTKGKRSISKQEFGKTVERETPVDNVLVHDIEFWARRVLERARKKAGRFYPSGRDRRAPVAYLWSRTVVCSNPSCRGQIPLIRSLVLCNRKDKKVALKMVVDRQRKDIRFEILKRELVEERGKTNWIGPEISRTDGTVQNRGNAVCPYCEQITGVAQLRAQGIRGAMGERMIAVVLEGTSGKDYRSPEETDIRAFRDAAASETDRPQEPILPEINAAKADESVSNSTGIRVHLYGMKTWGSLFNDRQLLVMQMFAECVHDVLDEMKSSTPDNKYREALACYLGLWVDRIAMFGNTVCRWEAGLERPKTPFGGQAIPMIWDYPEVNPFGNLAGTAETQLQYLTSAVARQAATDALAPSAVFLGSATDLTLDNESVNTVVTDPPYDDAIAYGDLSDFFYIWLKRTIGDVFPNVFATPLTPKQEEATSLKHRHEGSADRARAHYRKLLTASFREALRVVKPPKLVTVMFAHQSTDAWTALIGALLDAGLSPDATWPIATEMPTTALALGTASLETSVTVACRPRVVGTAQALKKVREEIESVVKDSVARFWSYGFRGSDLMVACYGPAVGVFGKYERVEKSDGTPVSIPELLDLARKAARDAIAGEFRGDNLSTLYYVWSNLYGASEQRWDDARLLVQIGGDSENPVEAAKGNGLFIVDGPKCRLALLADRIKRRGLGLQEDPPLIDALHRAMLLWKQEKRQDLISYLVNRDLLTNDALWKLAQSLFDVLPRDLEDWKLVSALLSERDTLRAEGRKTTASPAQGTLGLR